MLAEPELRWLRAEISKIGQNTFSTSPTLPQTSTATVSSGIEQRNGAACLGWGNPEVMGRRSRLAAETPRRDICRSAPHIVASLDPAENAKGNRVVRHRLPSRRARPDPGRSRGSLLPG